MAEKAPVRLGGSLKVPNVQELAKETLSELPPRYAHPGQEPTAHIFAGAELQIPVIDLQRLSTDNVANSELSKLHAACIEWGFFQITNHGLSLSLMEKVKKEIQEFFKLPVEEKQKYEQLPDDVEGYGQAFVKSEEQKLDWADMFYMTVLPVTMRKSHLLPKLPHELRDSIEEYSAELKSLAMKIIDFMSQGLEMDKRDLIMKELFDEGIQSMRFNFYPPCPQPELAIGLTPHSDPVGLTILLEVNEKEGLEIRKHGKWIPVKPVSNAFIVNVGDIIEIVSNGAYRSIEHRAVVNSEQERLSLATFLLPRLDGLIRPAPSLVTPKTPAVFKEIITADFLKLMYARELRGKSQVEILRIQN